MRMNNKGFSMVELLAVVAILGVLSTIGVVAVSNILEKAHEEYYKNQEKNLVLAAQSYMNANQNELPKVVGRKEKITAKELKEANYLKKDVTRYDGKTKCNDEKTYVNVFKYGNSDYSYTAYLTCPDDKIADEEVKEEQPFIDAVFPGSNEDVSTASIKITIKGEKNNAETKLLSYSYSLFVIENGKSVELLNTGTMQVRQSTVEKTISLSKYALSSSSVSLKIKATATNIKGNSISQTFTNDYRDKTAPKCVYINKADDPKSPLRRKTWVNRDVKVTIGCNDGNGSGCEKDTYTKTFTTDGGVDHIKISDNVGNQQSCPVVKFIDKTAPTVKVNVYKCDSKHVATGSVLKSYTASGNTIEVKSSDLTGNVNGWLNKANYPNGVCFAFNVEDASSLKSKSWKWNPTGIKKNASNYKTLTGGNSDETFTTDDGYNLTTKKVYTHSLSGDGHRYGEFVVKDGIGNTSTIKFNILIDKTSPTAQVTAGRCENRDATACQNATSVTSSQTVKADNSSPSKSMSFDTWVSKGIQIKYSITDLSDVTRTWKYDDPRKMTSRPSANKAGASATGTSGTLTLTGTGQRNSIITFTDEAGNTSQVTVQGYIANTCTVTYNSNHGSFTKNSSDLTEVKDYDSYFGSAANGLRNATGNGSHYEGERQYHSTVTNKQWNTSATYNAGTIFDEQKRYKAQSVCSGMDDGKDKTITLYANWRTHECTVTFSANGGKFTNNGGGTTQIVKAGEELGKKPTVSRDYYHVDNNDAWKKGSTTNYVAANATKKGEELCNLTKGDDSVTLNANWKQNVCTIKYDPNKKFNGKFNKNASNTTDTLTQGQILGSYENGIKNARGTGGYFYATAPGHVVAATAEWNLKDDGTGLALYQGFWYTQEEICPQLQKQASPTVTLYVNWLPEEPTVRIYLWDHISNSDDECDQYKDSNKDYTGTKNKFKRPYRKYKYGSYMCHCRYKSTNSELDYARGYYLRHKKTDGCDSTPQYYSKTTSKWQRDTCFPENAYIFYKFGDEGRASCHNKQNYKVGNTKRDWKINEYVYLVCTNGDVYNNQTKGYKFFHGAYWYWNTGPYYAHLGKVLINDKEMGKYGSNLYENKVVFDDGSDIISQDYEKNHKSKVQGICQDYCEDKFGFELYPEEDLRYLGIDEDDD